MNDLMGIATSLQGTNFKGTPKTVDFKSFRGAETIEQRREALRESAKQFEAVFVHQMISAMRKTVSESSLMPKSNGQKIFEGMLDEEWSKKLVNKSGPGSLSEILYRQLSTHMGLDEVEESTEGVALQDQPWPAPPAVLPVKNGEARR